MAETRNTTLTIAGMNLLAKTQQGKELHFTRVMMGDGKIPEGMNIKDMTALVNPILRLPIGNIRLDGTGTSVMECVLKNAELEQGFFARELGIYANDPDTEEEVLYAIRNTGDYSEYIPAAGSGEVINYVYSVITVVGQSENVTVTIEEGIGGVSRAEYYDHVNDVNPHPNFLQAGGTVDNCLVVFVGEQNNARRLDRITTDNLRKVLLGSNASTLPIINGRISQLEIEMANLGIRVDNPPTVIVGAEEPAVTNAVWFKVPTYYDTDYANSIWNDLDLSNMAFYDNFSPVEDMDLLKVSVNAITAGSRTIGVASLDGVKPGQWLTISDGVNSEEVQVKSSSKNGGVLRVITKEDVVGTYRTESTVIQRSTANLTTKVQGASGKQGIQFNAGESIVSQTKEFAEDGIRALAFAQAMIHHDALPEGQIRAYVTFGDEISTKKDVSIGTTTGERQTLQLPDAGVDYNTIEIKVGGVKFLDFSANTEPSHPEITLTAEEAGQEITASYKCGYGAETWNEMQLVSQQAYGESGRMASKFEYALPEGQTTSTRTAIKFVYDSDNAAANTVVYAVEIGWAKAAE